MSNNKSKIEKLNALQEDEQQKQGDGIKNLTKMQALENLVKIIKLNEELTDENNRLISKLEKIDKERSIWHNYYNDLSANNKSLTNQLQTIKSKWWYKLMMWEW